MRTLVAASLGLVLCGMVAGAASAQETCPVSPAVIHLHTSASEPLVDNSQPSEQVRALATALRQGGRLIGLYVGNFNASALPTYEIQQRGNGLCVRTTEVSVALTVEPRKIYVTNDRLPGSCEYKAVLDHERQHQAIDDGLLKEYGPVFREAVRQALARIGTDPVPLGRKADAERRLSQAMERALRQAFARLGAERNRRQQGLDTQAEYVRIMNACR